MFAGETAPENVNVYLYVILDLVITTVVPNTNCASSFVFNSVARLSTLYCPTGIVIDLIASAFCLKYKTLFNSLTL